MTAALAWAAGAQADVLHASYRVSLIGLPIGAVNLNADLTPTSYAIAAPSFRISRSSVCSALNGDLAKIPAPMRRQGGEAP